MSLYKISNHQTSLDGDKIEVKWNDNHVSRYHANWIRFNCQCESCRPQFSGLYKIDILDFPDKMVINKANLHSNAELHVEFQEEAFPDHVTIAPFDWLRKKCYCDDCLEDKLAKRDVITKSLRQREKSGVNVIPELQYNDVNGSIDGVFKWIKHMVEDGLCLLKNVPSQEGCMEKLIKQISCLESTNYGEVFQVKDTGSQNAAFTKFKLPFHQDQPNYETPPGFQFLNAFRFDECVTGGESKLTDLFQAVDILRQESPEDFQALCEVPTIYSTIDYDRDVYVESCKPNVVMDYYGKVVALNWHPALSTTLQVKECDVNRYYKAHRALLKIIRRETFQFKFRLEKGDMICFSNRRMLHAREAFQSNGGVRHLKGTYIKADDMKSKYMSLAHKLGMTVHPPKIGNNSSI